MASWLVRLLFGAMLMFGAEILVWVNPPGRSVLDWLLLVPGYILLAAVVLDVIVRYRVRDLFGALVVTGFFSLLAALVLNPQYAFAEMPRTFITRVMGAQALLAMEMLGLFLVLTGGGKTSRRLFLLGCLIVGIAWGFWVRWWPPDEGYPLVDLPTMLLCGAVGIIAITALLFIIAPRTRQLTIDNLRLSRVSLGIVFLLLVGFFVLRLIQTGIDSGGLILTGLLLVICWAILWFRERTKGETLLDNCIPIQPPPLPYLLVAFVIFFATAIFAYNLPLIQIEQANQLSLIGVGFTAYGLAWLPTVSLVLGIRAYGRQISKSRTI